MGMADKRKAEGGALVAKRAKSDISESTALTTSSKKDYETLMKASKPRTSDLFAPIMQLTGHGGKIYSTNFSPDGKSLVSASFDKRIFLWNVYGECENYAVLEGHKNAVLEAQYATGGSQLVSCSADKSAMIWDIERLRRLRRLGEHDNYVNSCSASRESQLIVTGSDDATSKVWDQRVAGSIATLPNQWQVTSVCFNKNSDQIFTGGLDNDIKVWDFKMKKIIYSLRGHVDTVTGLSLSPDGDYLLSNSMDNTLKMWDTRPFAPSGRLKRQFIGLQHNVEKNLLRCAWSPDGALVSAGSADQMVYIWQASDAKMVYRLPGHKGSVNDVAFHPVEPIIASCSSDQTIFLGEIDHKYEDTG